jgi:hypothetical protein
MIDPSAMTLEGVALWSMVFSGAVVAGIKFIDRRIESSAARRERAVEAQAEREADFHDQILADRRELREINAALTIRVNEQDATVREQAHRILMLETEVARQGGVITLQQGQILRLAAQVRGFGGTPDMEARA